jgi:hypothetical protein
MIVVDTSQLDEIIRKMEQRATQMVPEAIAEGESYAQSHAGRRMYRRLYWHGSRVATASRRGRPSSNYGKAAIRRNLGGGIIYSGHRSG